MQASSGLERKKGRRRKKGGRAGPDDSALPRQAGWRGKPGPRLARALRLVSVATLPCRCMWHGKGFLPRHATRRGQKGHSVQIMFVRGYF
jgi:hypothetical protein